MITRYGHGAIGPSLIHTEASSMEGRGGGCSKSRKTTRGFTALLTPSLPLGRTNKGNQQEAPSSQTPGAVSHPTWGPALLSCDHTVLKHWPTLLCSLLALSSSLFLLASLARPVRRSAGDRSHGCRKRNGPSCAPFTRRGEDLAYSKVIPGANTFSLYVTSQTNWWSDSSLSIPKKQILSYTTKK